MGKLVGGSPELHPLESLFYPWKNNGKVSTFPLAFPNRKAEGGLLLLLVLQRASPMDVL